MSQKYKGKPRKKRIVTIILVVVLLVFLLFPRRFDIKDGGSVLYCGFAGIVYQVEQRHRIYDLPGYAAYEVGTVVRIFFIEVFNNSHVDYEHARPLGHSPEVEALDKELGSLYESETT